MSRKTGNIFLHFLEKDTQEIFGFIGNEVYGNAYVESLKKGVNASVLLCDINNYCIIPVGFWFESELSRRILTEKAEFLRQGYIRLSVREENLGEYIEKKRENYYEFTKRKETEKTYRSFFDNSAYSELKKINPVLIDRETKIGIYCLDLWEESHNLLITQNTGDLLSMYSSRVDPSDVMKMAQIFRDVAQRRDQPFIWGNVRDVYTKYDIRDNELKKQHRFLFERNYYKAYLEEYNATILHGFYLLDKGLDFGLDFPDNSITNYRWFESFLNSLSLKKILDASAKTIVQIKQTDAWGYLLHAYVSLCDKGAFQKDSATKASMVHEEIRQSGYDEYVKEIRDILVMSDKKVINNSIRDTHIDVLIMVATSEEEEAILRNGDGWIFKQSSQGYGYYLHKEGLQFALARTTGMGKDNAATGASFFINELNPKYISMAGFCAGKKGKVNLGDVFVPNKVFDYDCNGKQLSEVDFLPDLKLKELDPLWLQKIERFGNDWRQTVSIEKPITYESQYKYFLELLINNSFTINLGNLKSLENKERIPDIRSIILNEIQDNNLAIKGSIVTASEQGKDKYSCEYYLKYETYTDKELTVRIGALATGSVVQEWDAVFDKLQKQYDRKTYAIDMEGYAIALVADFYHKPFIIAKGVGDYASSNKAFDNRYLSYAVNSSYRFLVSFFDSLKGPELLDQK